MQAVYRHRGEKVCQHPYITFYCKIISSPGRGGGGEQCGDQIIVAKTIYRLELPFLEDPREDEAAKRHRHDEDEGERQRGLGGLHYPQSHNARQLDDGEHVHAPCLHLKTTHRRWLEGRKQIAARYRCTEILTKLFPCAEKVLHIYGAI